MFMASFQHQEDTSPSCNIMEKHVDDGRSISQSTTSADSKDSQIRPMATLVWAPQGFRQQVYRPIQFRPLVSHERLASDVSATSPDSCKADPLSDSCLLSATTDFAMTSPLTLNSESKSGSLLPGSPSTTVIASEAAEILSFQSSQGNRQESVLVASVRRTGRDTDNMTDMNGISFADDKAAQAPGRNPVSAGHGQWHKMQEQGELNPLQAGHPESSPLQVGHPSPPPIAPKPNRGVRLFLTQQHKACDAAEGSKRRSSDSYSTTDEEDVHSVTSDTSSRKSPPPLPPKPRSSRSSTVIAGKACDDPSECSDSSSSNEKSGRSSAARPDAGKSSMIETRCSSVPSQRAPPSAWPEGPSSGRKSLYQIVSQECNREYKDCQDRDSVCSYAEAAADVKAAADARATSSLPRSSEQLQQALSPSEGNDCWTGHTLFRPAAAEGTSAMTTFDFPLRLPPTRPTSMTLLQKRRAGETSMSPVYAASTLSLKDEENGHTNANAALETQTEDNMDAHNNNIKSQHQLEESSHPQCNQSETDEGDSNQSATCNEDSQSEINPVTPHKEWYKEMFKRLHKVDQQGNWILKNPDETATPDDTKNLHNKEDSKHYSPKDTKISLEDDSERQASTDFNSGSESPTSGHSAYRKLQLGGEVPLTGFRKKMPIVKQQASQRVTVVSPPPQPSAGYYRDQVLPDRKQRDELHARRRQLMQQVEAEEKQRKAVKEQLHLEARRHSDFFIPAEKSPILPNRFDDPSDKAKQQTAPAQIATILTCVKARALFPFAAKNAKELSLQKDDIINITGHLDSNWLLGELNGNVGIVPTSYVEALPPPEATRYIEGLAMAVYSFTALEDQELSLQKGESVYLVKRVDSNWYEARVNDRQGIVPVSYLEVYREPVLTASLSAKGDLLPSPYPATTNQTNSKAERRQLETRPYRVTYSYEPRRFDELALDQGDVVHVAEICDDGWLIGTSARTGLFGTFPGNYVVPF